MRVGPDSAFDPPRGGNSMIEVVRRSLTRMGEITATPAAFALLAIYAGLWIVFDRQGFDWHAFATLATLFMTLVIQRAEYRDTQASGEIGRTRTRESRGQKRTYKPRPKGTRGNRGATKKGTPKLRIRARWWRAQGPGGEDPGSPVPLGGNQCSGLDGPRHLRQTTERRASSAFEVQPARMGPWFRKCHCYVAVRLEIVSDLDLGKWGQP